MALMGDVVAADGSTWKLRVQQSVKPGEEAAGRLIEIANRSTDGNPTPGELLLATATKRDKPSAEVSWSIVVLNEASFAYVARSPTTRDATAKRLSYFLPFLEHADPVIAEDAYLEFAHAPLDEIGKLADRLPVDRLRDWLADADLPPERKGLYGLLLGLSASAQGRADIADDFWGWITAPASDFRSGFDGVLGGYLWMGRQEALARLEDRYLGDPPGAFGDLRHLQTAMRVYHDYGRDVALEEFMRGYRRFLDHPAVAALAVADLSRWQDWQSVDRVASIFGQPGYDDPVTDRAIIGYLLACPLPEARRRVVRLRKLLPDRVTAAERTATTTSGGK